MPRRRRQKPPPQKVRAGPFHAPFQELAGIVRPAAGTDSRAAARRPSGRRMAAVPTPPAARAVEDDGDSFRRAMADVTRLAAGENRVDAPAPALERPRTSVDEESEALAALSDLVAGGGVLDVSDSREYVEGSVVGLDPRILRRLRRGEFAYQAMLDLHGLTAAEGRTAVQRFVDDARTVGHRAVLIVHGRGLNSRGQTPVLKEGLKQWLAQGRVSRSILAFTSARPADGGTGAVYVLLRRRRGPREPIDVYDGAKREP